MKILPNSKTRKLNMNSETCSVASPENVVYEASNSPYAAIFCENTQVNKRKTISSPRMMTEKNETMAMILRWRVWI